MGRFNKKIFFVATLQDFNKWPYFLTVRKLATRCYSLRMIQQFKKGFSSSSLLISNNHSLDEKNYDRLT